MPADLRIKLLDLTRYRQQLTLDKLAQEIQVRPSGLISKLESLRSNGFISYDQNGVAVDAKQRIMMAEQLIHEGRDPQKVSRSLEWQEFEDFASHSLAENGFHTVTHVVFKTRQGRREVDILAWNDNFFLAIDCKHWAKGLNPSRMKTAAQAQIERVTLLAERPDLLMSIGLRNPERRSIMPMLFTLGEPRVRAIDGIPTVAISKLVTFLYGISPVDENYVRIRVRDVGMSLLPGTHRSPNVIRDSQGRQP